MLFQFFPQLKLKSNRFVWAFIDLFNYSLLHRTMDYRPFVVISTVILTILDAAHFGVGCAVSSETSADRANYLGPWVINLIASIFSLKSLVVGTYTSFKHITEGFELTNGRFYDLLNSVLGIGTLISLSAIGNSNQNSLAHMFFSFTAGFYVIKTVFSSSLLCSRCVSVPFGAT